MPIVEMCAECNARAGTCNCYDWEEEEVEVCSRCGVVELDEGLPYYHCDKCRGKKVVDNESST